MITTFIMVACPKIQRGTLLKGGDISTHNFPKKTVKGRKLVDDQLNSFSVVTRYRNGSFFMNTVFFVRYIWYTFVFLYVKYFHSNV